MPQQAFPHLLHISQSSPSTFIPKHTVFSSLKAPLLLIELLLAFKCSWISLDPKQEPERSRHTRNTILSRFLLVLFSDLILTSSQAILQLICSRWQCLSREHWTRWPPDVHSNLNPSVIGIHCAYKRNLAWITLSWEVVLGTLRHSWHVRMSAGTLKAGTLPARLWKIQHLFKMNLGLKAEYQLVGMSVAKKMRGWGLGLGFNFLLFSLCTIYHFLDNF